MPLPARTQTAGSEESAEVRSPVLALDIGGTKLAAGVVDRSGRVHSFVVIPSEAGTTAAANQFVGISPDQFSIVNAPGKDSAPISGYSWLMLYKDQPDKTKGTALVDFLYWLVTPEGQQYAVNLHYAALPSDMVSFDTAALKTVTSGGSVLLSVSS